MVLRFSKSNSFINKNSQGRKLSVKKNTYFQCFILKQLHKYILIINYMGGGSLFCNTEVRSNPIFICSFLRLIASLFARCAGLCNAQSHTLAVAIIKKLFFKVTSLISLFRCRMLHCGRHSLNPVSNQINRMHQQHGWQEIGIYLRISIPVIKNRPSSKI